MPHPAICHKYHHPCLRLPHVVFNSQFCGAALLQATLSFTTTEQHVPAHLPPVGVLLVDYMEDVSLEKGQACLFTGDQVVCGRIIVEVWLQIDLKFRM